MRKGNQVLWESGVVSENGDYFTRLQSDGHMQTFEDKKALPAQAVSGSPINTDCRRQVHTFWDWIVIYNMLYLPRHT